MKHRSSVTGKFVTARYAAQHPRTTEAIGIKKTKKTKTKKHA